MRDVTFYYDFISPFAYLASQSLHTLDGLATLTPCPVLLAAILGHHATRGPAEIEPMRRFTYRHIRWLADQHGIPLRFPPAHPFNPLRLLRLAVALDADPARVTRLFRFVWAEGRSSDDADAWRGLCTELGVDGDTLVADRAVKQRLRDNNARALAAGVFGVPCFAVDGELFWGFDALDFLAAYIRDPGLLQRPGMRAADALPVGVQRSS
jgi:2-hydroxychromene-2-carboxylate isomerase